jgi:DNA-directed RNA polymerase subunit RPC12/RpoP
MQTNATNELSCSVFGHNLERSSMASQANQELTCKTCNSKILVSDDGEFNVHPFRNRDISVALRQLFVLKNQQSARSLSV